jgi:pimeloyl-ACP methyl ester carboxylesterase
MVDLGGYRIHLYCSGSGNQTIVLSPGGGDFSFVWYLVQQQVQTFARVCSYDRPGYA